MRATKTLLRCAGLLGIAGAMLGGGGAWADTAGPVVAGKAVAQRWCVSCHVVSTTQKQGSDQAPTWRAVANRPGTSSDSLHAFLAHPHGKMPDFKLSSTDVDNVVAYILSLKR